MSQSQQSGDPRFRVSDVYEVPHRGTMVRLKLLEGAASVKGLRPGRALWLAPAQGEGRRVTIKDVGLTSGRGSQKRLDETRELDVLISADDAGAGPPVRIGWEARPDDADR
ncbi:MAG TPA: hypothetical protein VMK65_01570 [Longimicrobiales bacterium]|nr:hypothetical protein [Longimicrobiales bacterium]